MHALALIMEKAKVPNPGYLIGNLTSIPVGPTGGLWDGHRLLNQCPMKDHIGMIMLSLTFKLCMASM